jgi:catechol 2,3-dioxygenase-like lactoylglutathione lyase family enzyme
MTVIGIDKVEFVVQDAAEAERYLLAWGLVQADSDAGTLFTCVDGSGVGFVEETTVAGQHRPYPTIREVTWGVSDQAALDALGSDLAHDRTVTETGGTLHTTDDSGLAIALRVTRKQPIEGTPPLVNAPGAATRIDTSAAFYEKAIPHEISHLVLGVENLETNEAFYRHRLGFHVSDRYINRGVFLRAPAVGHHHNLFLLDDGKFTFNHLAFKVHDIHEVIGGGQGFTRWGAETLVGPGRHFASSGCFWYFKSPFGGALEYVADEDVVTPAWEPSELSPSPERFSEWVFHTGGELGTLKEH